MSKTPSNVSISDLIKDCRDALSKATVHFDAVLEERMRCLKLADRPMAKVATTACPAVVRHGGPHQTLYICGFCRKPSEIHSLRKLRFMPAYFVACCFSCANVMYRTTTTATTISPSPPSNNNNNTIA